MNYFLVLRIVTASFFVLFLMRHSFCKKKIGRVLFYFGFLVSFLISLVGASVISDQYQRFDTFVSLEKEKKTIDLEKIDPMLAIDFKEFKDSRAFQQKIKDDEERHMKICCFSYAYFLVILTDIVYMLMYFSRRLYEKLFKKAKA